MELLIAWELPHITMPVLLSRKLDPCFHCNGPCPFNSRRCRLADRLPTTSTNPTRLNPSQFPSLLPNADHDRGSRHELQSTRITKSNAIVEISGHQCSIHDSQPPCIVPPYCAVSKPQAKSNTPFHAQLLPIHAGHRVSRPPKRLGTFTRPLPRRASSPRSRTSKTQPARPPFWLTGQSRFQTWAFPR